MSTSTGLMAIAALLIINAFFVAAEFSLVAVDRARIEAAATDGDPGARRVRALLHRLTSHLSGAQFGITLSALLLGFVAEPTVARILTGDDHPTGASVVVAILVATCLHLVVGEQVPKYLALAAPEPLARGLAPAVTVIGVIGRPLVAVLDGAANAVVRRLGVIPRTDLDPSRTLDEIGDLIRTSADETLDSDDVALLTRSVRLADKVAAEVLVPRLDVHSLDVSAVGADLLAEAERTGCSRFPVIDGDLDHVVGIVHVKALLTIARDSRDRVPVAELMAPALAVPETRALDGLMDDFRAARSALAVVVDEHGGTAGLVTEEDVVEELIGEIDDDLLDLTGKSAPLPRTQVDGPGNIVVSGRLGPDDVYEATGFAIPDGPYETLAGYVLHRLGRIPEPTARIDHEGWRIEVLAVDGRRIETLRMVAPAPSPPETEAEPGSHRW